ncbi:MAG TPA: acyltransferase [Pyrinomonadaceae bacterium]
MKQGVGRVGSLDTLRGLSALAVCWYHFSGNRLVGPGLIRDSGTYGWLGVDVFFVISGFVIPFALHREGYTFANYRTFLLKRIARLYPPYLASVAIGFGLLVLYSVYKGQPHVEFSARDLLLHLAFLNGFFGRPWLNSIYWSLAIEMQYYLLIGLLFPILSSGNVGRRYLGYAALVLPVIFLPSSVFLFHFGSLFLLGVVTFQYSSGLLERSEYCVLLGVCGLGIFTVLGLPAVFAGAFAIVMMRVLKQGIRLTNMLGEVSYSFYLLHSSVGSLILYFMLSLVANGSELEKLFAIVVSVGAAIGVATVAYYLIERPAIRSSAAMRYVSRPGDAERETIYLSRSDAIAERPSLPIPIVEPVNAID